MGRGFTILQLLVVVAILGLLAAMLFPVFAQAKESAQSTTCLSNHRQLGHGLVLYASDQDEKVPTRFAGLFGGGRRLGLGWAGAIYPYVSKHDTFVCPGDDTTAPHVVGGPTPSVVSYAINSNLARSSSLSEASATSRTVFLFEVAGNTALITDPDEGVSGGYTVTGQQSAEGNGLYGTILSNPTVWTGKGQGRFTRYATGVMDNAGTEASGDDYQGQAPRHREGSNFLALDGHTNFAHPRQISAGYNAADARTAQRSTGCGSSAPQFRIFGCAEGTDMGAHRLTFSVR